MHDACTARIMELEEAFDLIGEKCAQLLAATQRAEERRDRAEAVATTLRNATWEWVEAKAAVIWADSVTPDDLERATARYEEAQQNLRGVALMIEDLGGNGDIIIIHRGAIARRDARLAACQLANLKGP